MGIFVASIIVVLGLVVVGYIAFVVLGRKASTYDPNRLDDARVEVLRYVVPDGQDPVVVVSALRREGFDAVSDMAEGSEVVVVPCPAGADRERARVRSVIGAASQTSLEGPEFDPGRIRFDDEKTA